MKRIQSSQSICPNCGARISSAPNFCPECGQEHRDLNVPLRHLIGEAVENVFHFDTKTIRSLKALLFKPGFLTLEFTNGKRMSYVPPVRLYVFISFIFFLLLSLPVGKDTSETTGKKSRHLNLTFHNINSAGLQGLQISQLDSVMQAENIERTPFNVYMVRQLARIGATEKSEFSHQILKSVSYMMFLLMPVFGFIVYLFFRNNIQYYLGALMFSIHYHSFMFIVLAVLVLAHWVSGWSILLLLPLIVFPWYLYVACRRAYGNPVVKTIWKIVVVAALQIVVSISFFLLTIVFNIMTF